MARIEFNLTSALPPERILAAATDFSEARPDLWPAISRRYYKVHDQGEGWCDCTEGSDVAGGIWAREHYEWSGNTVTATVRESNIFKGGTWQLRVDPAPDGGCTITVVNDRRPKGKGLLFAPVMLVNGKKILARNLQETIALLESQPSETKRPAE